MRTQNRREDNTRGNLEAEIERLRAQLEVLELKQKSQAAKKRNEEVEAAPHVGKGKAEPGTVSDRVMTGL